jgi:hypothetical protein
VKSSAKLGWARGEGRVCVDMSLCLFRDVTPHWREEERGLIVKDGLPIDRTNASEP